MYSILVVDDEPRVSAGIRNLLLRSELNIAHVETALNGFEAIDYIRMDPYDLVLTDIQMSRMNGIELMETIQMEQPQLPVVVISAHEKFDFAKRSLSLGARDYLVKPVERDELLRVVGKVLQEKERINQQTTALSEALRKRESAKSDAVVKHELLAELVNEGHLSHRDRERLLAALGRTGERKDMIYAAAAIRLDLTRGGFSSKEIGLQDRRLLKYAAVNIVDESLAEWAGMTLGGSGSSLTAVLALQQADASDDRADIRSQLHLIGRRIHMNLLQYLNLDAVVGISKPHPDIFMLPKLADMAGQATERRYLHPGNRVFYAEDRGLQEQANLGIIDWAGKVDRFVQHLKAGAARQAGGGPEGPHSLHPTGAGEAPSWEAPAGEAGPAEQRMTDAGAASVIALLRGLGESEAWFNSCFGMLVYRIYALLLEGGHAGGVSLQRFDPDVYFRGADRAEKLDRLAVYIREVREALERLVLEREQSVVSRMTAYIRGHYRNPALKIQDIAAELHFSSAYLSYLFKKETKQNLWDYVTELRLEEARRLLVTTDKKQYEIAYAVGYESPEHFSRMFKRCVGIGPADYRKAARGEVR